MRIAFAPRKHHYLTAVGIILIVAALVIGVAACDGAGADTYELTISSPSGGSVATPGEGTFTYDAGMVVPLVATPDDGYQFGSWTGDIANIADPNSVSSTITMNGNYAILATFETEGETDSDEEPIVPPSS
jgi:hypothetical protein